MNTACEVLVNVFLWQRRTCSIQLIGYLNVKLQLAGADPVECNTAWPNHQTTIRLTAQKEKIHLAILVSVCVCVSECAKSVRMFHKLKNSIRVLFEKLLLHENAACKISLHGRPNLWKRKLFCSNLQSEKSNTRRVQRYLVEGRRERERERERERWFSAIPITMWSNASPAQIHRSFHLSGKTQKTDSHCVLVVRKGTGLIWESAMVMHVFRMAT